MGGGLQSAGVVTSAGNHLSANTLALQGSQAVQLRSMRAGGGRTGSSGAVRWLLWLWMGGVSLSRTALGRPGSSGEQVWRSRPFLPYCFGFQFFVWFSLFCFYFCCLIEGKLDVLVV